MACALLRRNPDFALVAILTLALGTGANTAIFQLVDAVACGRCRSSVPQQLVELKIVNAQHGRTGSFIGSRPNFSYPLWERIRARAAVFSGMLAWTTTNRDMATSGESRPVHGLSVSGDYFTTLGVRARAGRAASLPPTIGPAAAAPAR